MSEQTYALKISEPYAEVEDKNSGKIFSAKEWRERLWKERTLSLWSHDDNNNKIGIPSKAIRHVTLYTISDRVGDLGDVLAEGVYCIDRMGSKKGYIITGCNEILKATPKDTNIHVRFRDPCGREVADWLEQNFDPEKKATGAILGEMCAVTEQAKAEITSLINTTNENLTELRTLHHRIIEESRKSEKERLSGLKARKSGLMVAVAAFALGALLDIGLLEDHGIITLSNYEIIGLLIILFIFILCLGAPVIWKVIKSEQNE